MSVCGVGEGGRRADKEMLWTCEESGCSASTSGFPGGSVVKNLPANEDVIPDLGRSCGGGHGNPLQYSCLGNPMDRGAWRATVHGVAKSPTQLSN